MIAGRQILCLSTQDWNDLWTRKQRFMQRLARQGNQVLYVETEASLVSFGLLRGDPGRAWRWLKGPRAIEPGLYVATLPLVIPCFQMSLAINALDSAMIASSLRRWTRQLGFENHVLWTYSPCSEGLVGRLGESVAIYDCVDEHAAARGLVRRSVVEEQERRLMQKVSAIVVTHEALRRSKATSGRPVVLVPNGAEVEHFARASAGETMAAPEVASLPSPVVGFIGSVQYWIDFDLVRYLATSRPHWSFVLVGPIGRLARVDLVAALPNVHLLGRRPYAALPEYVKAFDVCLNPYVVDDVARHCSPLKLFEYLASGKPIVSVDMPAAVDFEGFVAIGRSYAEVLDKLDEAVATPDPGGQRAAARMAEAARHSWDARFEALEAAIFPHLP